MLNKDQLAALWMAVCYVCLCCAFVVTRSASAEFDFNALLAQLVDEDAEESVDVLPEIRGNQGIDLPLEQLDAPGIPLESPSQENLETIEGPVQLDASGNILQSPRHSDPQSIIDSAESVESAPIVDFESLFDQQDRQPTDAVMTCPQTGSQGRALTSLTGYGSHPALPPPRSMEASYHASPCARDIWQGYDRKQAAACEKLQRTIHGNPHCKDCNTHGALLPSRTSQCGER